MKVLSTDDLTVLDYLLSRMAGNAFGAVGLLPTICAHCQTENALDAVEDRFESWRACLVTGRDILQPTADQRVNDSLEIVEGAIEGLRDTFKELTHYRELPTQSIIDAQNKLSFFYRRMDDGFEKLGVALGIRFSVFAKRGSLKIVCHNRSLDNLVRTFLEVGDKGSKFP